MASRKSPLFDTATTVGKIMSFLGVSALCGLLAAGLIFPLAATGGAAAAAGSDILDELPTELHEEPLSTPSRIYANDGETELATFYAENREPVDIDEISQEMQDAMVAIEDERFYEHGGVDARGVTRAAIHNLTSSTEQGASTLTMQYVNNVLVNAAYLRGESRLTISGTGEKTYADKLQEMRLAVSVENEMTKEEILEGYLNIVLLGGRNYGVEAAAQYYWGVSASELDIQRSAVLAGMVQSPNGYNPEVNPEASQSRRDVVLDAMLETGKITQEEYDEAVDVDVAEDLEINREEAGCVSGDLANYFCDYVEEVILSDDTFGPDRESRQELLNRGGLRVETTLDPNAQQNAEEEARAAVPADDPEAVGTALSTVEPGTGNILAMAQNTNYDPDSEGTGNTTINFNADFDYGNSGGFAAGSTLKPFVAAAYLEEGGEMDDEIDASEDHYPQYDSWDAHCLPNGTATILDDDGWSIDNVADDAEREMTVDYGLYYSVNTATAATAKGGDLCTITELTDRLNIHNAYSGAGLDPSNPSFVLGAEEVAPLNLAAAYAAFAADGEYCTPRAISEVTDAHGTDYEIPESNCEQVLDEDVVAEVNDSMINIAEGQTANNDPNFPMAGKTGTNDTSSSTWFMGFTRGLSTAAWVGRYDGNEQLYDRTIAGEHYEEFFGSTIAAPMWLDYMNSVGDDYSTEDFPESDDSPFSDRRDMSRYANNGGGGGEGSDDGDEDSDDDDDD